MVVRIKDKIIQRVNMLRTFKNKVLIILTVLTLSVPTIIPLQASAVACNNIGTGIGKGISATAGTASPQQFGCNGQGSITSGIKSIAAKVVNIFSIIVGIVSVVMIIYAGFRYITSGGESGSVSNAQKTLIFAIIGLIVVVLAQIIVHYVLNTANNIGASTGP